MQFVCLFIQRFSECSKYVRVEFVKIMMAQSADDNGPVAQATNITWDDTFFQDQEDVIAVFDFDYALVEEFDMSVQKASLCCLLVPPVACVFLCTLQPCYMRKRVQWEVHSQHVCITRDGIRFVRDKRPTMCGMACTDAGKVSKTVPFDKITDCDITEPAGATCCVIQNVLSILQVDTASSGGAVNPNNGQVQHELSLRGLKDPHAFKKLVWDMKRSNGTYTPTVTAGGGGDGASYPSLAKNMVSPAPAVNQMVRSGGDDESVSLLKEIRDELRQQTKLLSK